MVALVHMNMCRPSTANQTMMQMVECCQTHARAAGAHQGGNAPDHPAGGDQHDGQCKSSQNRRTREATPPTTQQEATDMTRTPAGPGGISCSSGMSIGCT